MKSIRTITTLALAMASATAASAQDALSSWNDTAPKRAVMAFGDIVPVDKAARLLAVLEATGLFYVTILIARLIGLYAPTRRVTDPSE